MDIYAQLWIFIQLYNFMVAAGNVMVMILLFCEIPGKNGMNR